MESLSKRLFATEAMIVTDATRWILVTIPNKPLPLYKILKYDIFKACKLFDPAFGELIKLHVEINTFDTQ